jgi:hypothetical protein
LAAPSDVTIVGTVLALSVAILLLSGLALYVAFRVRETLRDEKGGGTRAVKVAFLIGLLFMSGGVFYFFASGFNVANGNTSTPNTASTTASFTSNTTPGSTSSSTTTSSTSSQATSTVSSTSSVSMPAPSCPTRVTAGSIFTCYITVYNQGSTTFNSATVVSSGDFASFAFQTCTESLNGGPASQVPTTSNTIALGNLPPGTIVLTLTVQAPTQSGQYSNSIMTLNAPGLAEPISATFAIQVTA